MARYYNYTTGPDDERIHFRTIWCGYGFRLVCGFR
jgi:hypothetical protein